MSRGIEDILVRYAKGEYNIHLATDLILVEQYKALELELLSINLTRGKGTPQAQLQRLEGYIKDRISKIRATAMRLAIHGAGR